LKWSDSSGIRKLTSIPFWKYKSRKIKRQRAWKSHPSKSNLAFCQCWPLVIQNSIFGATEVQLMQTQFYWFLTQRPTNAPNFSQKRCHMRKIWVFQDDNWILPANRFREETNPNYIPKHPNRHPSFYFSNLAPLVIQSRRSGKAATNLKPPTTNQPPAASRQPPATFTLPPSLDVHTWTLIFLTYNLCINRQLSLCY